MEPTRTAFGRRPTTMGRSTSGLSGSPDHQVRFSHVQPIIAGAGLDTPSELSGGTRRETGRFVPLPARKEPGRCPRTYTNRPIAMPDRLAVRTLAPLMFETRLDGSTNLSGAPMPASSPRREVPSGNVTLLGKVSHSRGSWAAPVQATHRSTSKTRIDQLRRVPRGDQSHPPSPSPRDRADASPGSSAHGQGAGLRSGRVPPTRAPGPTRGRTRRGAAGSEARSRRTRRR
jgi:hypothetical protein